MPFPGSSIRLSSTVHSHVCTTHCPVCTSALSGTHSATSGTGLEEIPARRLMAISSYNSTGVVRKVHCACNA